LGKRIAIALLLLPAAEVAAFLLVVWAIGFLLALGLMIVTSFAGAVVLYRAGRGRITKALRTVRQSEPPAEINTSGGPMVAIAGILLLLPGFITDLVGAALLVRPIRGRLGAAIGRAFKVPGPPAGPQVINLAPGEWHWVPDRKRKRSERR
jgi:UPF0716 protein FxsA